MKSGFGALIMVWAIANTAPAQGQAAQLGNSVTCVYDALTLEEREIALILLLQDLGSPYEGNTQALHEEVEHMIEDAHYRCLDHFRWLAGQSGNAKEYALAGLMKDEIAQTLRLLKRDPATIDAWFEPNRARLAMLQNLPEADSDSLRKLLKDKGWTDRGGRDPMTGALIYARLLQNLERLRRNFGRNFYYPSGPSKWRY